MGRLHINSREKPDWLVPRPVLCAFFWCGILFLFSGVVLLILSRNRGEDYVSWGGVFLGLGFMFILMCLILCLFAYCVITAEDERKRRVPWIKTYFVPQQKGESVDKNGKKYEEVPLKQVVSETPSKEPVYTEPIPKSERPASNGSAYGEPNGTVYARSYEENYGDYGDVKREDSGSPHRETLVTSQDPQSSQANGSPNRFQVADNGSPIATEYMQTDNGGQVIAHLVPEDHKYVSRNSASPNGNGNVSSDSSMRSRSNSTGSKTVSFKNPVVTAQIGRKKKEKKSQKKDETSTIEELPPTGKKEKVEVTSTEEESDYDEDEQPPTPPFPEWELASYGDYSEYGLPFNPAFDPNVKSAISEYDIVDAEEEDFESNLESSNVLAYTDVPVRRTGTGKRARDDPRRFSNPIKVHMRGKNYGLSQVSLYDNVRYVMD